MPRQPSCLCGECRKCKDRERTRRRRARQRQGDKAPATTQEPQFLRARSDNVERLQAVFEARVEHITNDASSSASDVVALERRIAEATAADDVDIRRAFDKGAQQWPVKPIPTPPPPEIPPEILELRNGRSESSA